MARFTIRVELHRATWQNYVDLASKLARHRIYDVIQADNGTWAKLPPAEYNYEGEGTIGQVRLTAAQCAASVVPSYAVFVTEAIRRAWVGLEQPSVLTRKSA